jgi:hypothetical protein
VFALTLPGRQIANTEQTSNARRTGAADLPNRSEQIWSYILANLQRH